MTSAENTADNDRRRAVRSLIEAESTLTLATAGATGPWSAPVYYVWLGERFYFFSSPQSRHIHDAIQSGAAAASIFHQGHSWQSLRGVQMAGSIQLVESMSLSIKVVAAYLKRYEFVRGFFNDDHHPTTHDFFSRFKARLYAFTPEQLYYVDNRRGFGSRQCIPGLLTD